MSKSMEDHEFLKVPGNEFLNSLIIAEPYREYALRPGYPSPTYAGQDCFPGVFCNPHENTCEAAARLLFMAVRWARNIPSFVNLPFRDQVILLEEGWRELFILGGIQTNLSIEVAPLLAAAGMHVDNTPAEKIVTTMGDIRLLQEITGRFRALHVCEAELACLKAVVLFKSGKYLGSQACFPPRVFSARTEQKQRDWLATNADDITIQSRSPFACSHEKI